VGADVTLGDLLAMLAAELAVPLGASAGIDDYRIRVSDLSIEMPAHLGLLSTGNDAGRVVIATMSPRDVSAAAVGRIRVVLTPEAGVAPRTL
jgi:hypothetical protein